jgi:hypothetical protein
MGLTHKTPRSLLLIGLPTLLLACGGSNEPSSSPIAGSYVATSWMTTGNSGQQNQLVMGSTLQITLAANGTTTGHLHVVASGASPALDADLAGTWALSGNVVTFTHATDTFVRNTPFTAGFNVQGVSTLEGDKTFSGTRIQITLTRGGEL